MDKNDRLGQKLLNIDKSNVNERRGKVGWLQDQPGDLLRGEGPADYWHYKHYGLPYRYPAALITYMNHILHWSELISLFGGRGHYYVRALHYITISHQRAKAN